MSDSEDSDYVVENFVKPDTVKRTYGNEDPLSDDELTRNSEDSNSEKSEDEEEVGDDPPVKNRNCVINGTTSKNERNGNSDAIRANNRFILYVTNLSSTTTKSMLEDYFQDAGQIKAIRIPKVRLGNFAFVEMLELQGYKAGLKFNNKELDGRKIQVYEGSKNKKHTSNKSKSQKRKLQQINLDKIKMRKKNE